MFIPGEAVVYDASQLYETFFENVPGHYFANPAIAFDTIMFITENLEVLCLQTPLLTKYFPNILKVSWWFHLFVFYRDNRVNAQESYFSFNPSS